MAISVTTKVLNFLLILAISFTIISASSSSDLGWVPPVKQACRGGYGKLGECLDLELGTSESSETHRRILATSNYIGYTALQRDSTPCSQRGASYYNCRPGAQANPYSRGCSAITQCRS